MNRITHIDNIYLIGIYESTSNEPYKKSRTTVTFMNRESFTEKNIFFMNKNILYFK